MANITITRGTTLPDSSAKSDFHGLVDNASATISSIENADISNSAAIADSKLAQITTAAKVSGAAITLLTSLPSGAGVIPSANLPSSTGVINLIIDGGGDAISTGIKSDLYIPFGATITSATLLADQTGSIVIDIWKDTYANYPPTVADTITASAKPTISSATKSTDSTLTGWTTTITAGNSLRFNVDSCTSIQRVVLALNYTRTS